MSSMDDMRGRLRRDYPRSVKPRPLPSRPIRVSEVSDHRPPTVSSPMISTAPITPLPPAPTLQPEHADATSWASTSSPRSEPSYRPRSESSAIASSVTRAHRANEGTQIEDSVVEPIHTEQPQQAELDVKKFKLTKIEKIKKSHIKKALKPFTPWTKKKTLITTGVGVVVLGGGLTGWILFGINTVQLPPKQYTSAATGFPIYFPTKLPKGYRIAPSSYSFKNGAFSFAVNTATGRSITIGEEAIPTGLNVGDIVPAPKSIKITDSTNVVLAGARSAISTSGGKTFISTVFGNTWYVMDVTGIPRDEALQLNQGFTRIR